MLTEVRFKKILDLLDERKLVTVADFAESIGVSESTIRRDLNSLSKIGKLIKVHGGATVIDSELSYEEHNVETKEKMFFDEKITVAKYAASTIRKNDFIFIDAGTTTMKMIDYITEKNITVVTNGFSHAKRLAARGFKVFILGGQIKLSTEAVVGTECITAIDKYNFTKCYLGTNGVSLTAGLTTPDIDEARVKSAAAKKSYITYILTDHSKFDKISSVTFSSLERVCIITDRLDNDKYKKKCVIKEVSK